MRDTSTLLIIGVAAYCAYRFYKRSIIKKILEQLGQEATEHNIKEFMKMSIKELNQYLAELKGTQSA